MFFGMARAKRPLQIEHVTLCCVVKYVSRQVLWTGVAQGQGLVVSQGSRQM